MTPGLFASAASDITLFLEVPLCYVPCLVALLVVEMCCDGNAGNSLAGLNISVLCNFNGFPVTGRYNVQVISLFIGDPDALMGLERKHLAVAARIGVQWPQLAGALGLSADDVRHIQKQCDGMPEGNHSRMMLKMWMDNNKDAATGTLNACSVE